LEKNFGRDLGKAKILLPNRRACRELREVFKQRNFNGFLPEIKAISDLSYEDFTDDAMDELLQIKVLDGIDQLIFLAKEIQKQSVFGEMSFEHACKIALRLRELFEDIERNQIDSKKLFELDDSSLAQHRQITLEFFKSFYAQLKNSLLKRDILFPTAYQNLVIQRFVECLPSRKSSAPIIIAGSTGSVLASRNLIQAISKTKNGFVVLHGAWEGEFRTCSKSLPADGQIQGSAPLPLRFSQSPVSGSPQRDWKQVLTAENHPQFFLSRLIKNLGKQPKRIAEERFRTSDEARQDMLAALMLPAEETWRWQKNKIDFEQVLKNFCLIEARNEIEEAKIIALILQEARGKSAVITNNRDLAKLLRLELDCLCLPYNDARNLDVFDSPLINFLLLILELKESDFNSHTLLALLKHPLCRYSHFAADFETKILRQDRTNPGLEGILQVLKSEPDLEDFFLNSILPLTTYHLPLSAENLSGKTWNDLLASEPAAQEIADFFTKIKTPNSVAEFKTLLSQLTYFEHSNAVAPIQILSSIEARLLNFDLVIVASLNEGDFPKIEAENWLGKKIKKDLGVDHARQKLGQNAYDFCNYLSNKSVVLTRCKVRNGAALIESPFLLKLKTLCQKSGVILDRGEKYFAALKKMNSPRVREIKAASPSPKKSLRPQKFSITEISKLINDPYSIYAKKILRLHELPKIDYEPGYAEFGSFMHKSLERFVQAEFEKYFVSQEARLTWLPRFQKIFSEFSVENEQFAGLTNLVELPVQLQVGEVLITGRVDRVILDDKGNAQIFDYKTGVVPSKKDVISGAEPQLTIAALALSDKYLITSVSYWKLPDKIQTIEKDLDEVLKATKSELERLFTNFSNDKTSYNPTTKTAEGEYKHLARFI